MKKSVVLLAVVVTAVLTGCSVKEAKEELTIYEEQVAIPGLEKALDIVFFADTHVALCDDRDSELAEYMAGRYEMFKNQDGKGSQETFHSIMSYVSQEKPDLLIMGGDIVDAATWASIEYVENALKDVECPWIYEMGNHDFNYGSIEYYSQKSFEEYLPRFEKISNTKDGYQYVEYESFIVFAVDDAGNQVSVAAADAFEKVCSMGKPIILISHVPMEPLEESTLIQDTVEVWGADDNGYSKVLMGEHAKRPNIETQKFIDLVMAEDSPVCLVLSGHIHFYHKDNLKGDLQQIVTGPGYNKELLKIELIPESQQ